MTQGDGMAEVTEADREKAYAVVNEWAGSDPLPHLLRRAVAAALAEEREKARTPFLALADELAARATSDEAQAARLDDWGFPTSGDVNRDNAREKRFYVDRIRRAAEETA